MEEIHGRVEDSKLNDGGRLGPYTYDSGDISQYMKIKKGLDKSFSLFEGDSGRVIDKFTAPEYIRISSPAEPLFIARSVVRGFHRYNISKRSYNVIYYRCDCYGKTGCKGKFILNCQSWEEAAVGHSIPRCLHPFYKLLTELPLECIPQEGFTCTL